MFKIIITETLRDFDRIISISVYTNSPSQLLSLFCISLAFPFFISRSYTPTQLPSSSLSFRNKVRGNLERFLRVYIYIYTQNRIKFLFSINSSFRTWFNHHFEFRRRVIVINKSKILIFQRIRIITTIIPTIKLIKEKPFVHKFHWIKRGILARIQIGWLGKGGTERVKGGRANNLPGVSWCCFVIAKYCYRPAVTITVFFLAQLARTNGRPNVRQIIHI